MGHRLDLETAKRRRKRAYTDTLGSYDYQGVSATRCDGGGGTINCSIGAGLTTPACNGENAELEGVVVDNGDGTSYVSMCCGSYNYGWPETGNYAAKSCATVADGSPYLSSDYAVEHDEPLEQIHNQCFPPITTSELL